MPISELEQVSPYFNIVIKYHIINFQALDDPTQRITSYSITHTGTINTTGCLSGMWGAAMSFHFGGFGNWVGEGGMVKSEGDLLATGFGGSSCATVFFYFYL